MTLTRADRERLYETALLQLMLSAPNMLLSMVMLVGLALPRTIWDVNPGFGIVWSAATLAIGMARQSLHVKFRNQKAEERTLHRRQWLWLAKHGSSVYGALFGLMIWATFPTGDLNDRLVLSLFVGAWAISGVRFTALVAGPLLAMLFGSIVGVWLLYGGELGLSAAIIGTSYYAMCELKRRRQIERDLEKVALVEQAQRLKENLASRNEQLEILNAEKSTLLATASHDLRQPVHALGILAENLCRLDLTSPGEGQLSNLRMEVESLGDMLRSLMDVSQLDLGIYPNRLSYFSIDELIIESAARYQVRAAQKGLKFELSALAVCDVEVFSNRMLLGSLLSNLISNAVKFTPTGRILVEAVLSNDGALCISVEDSGVGIAPDDLSEVFRAYVRVGALARRVSGLGIGLSIVRKGADLLGIGLDLKSHIGQGSRFTLRFEPEMLRKRANRCDQSSDTSTCIDVEDPSLRKRILLVEDDETILAAMQDLLQSWGHTVRGIANIESALAIASSKQFHPDLLLTDYHLDRGDTGLQCIARVRGLMGFSDLPCIVLTGDVRLTLDARFDPARTYILHKPLRPSVLREVIEALLRQAVQSATLMD